MPETKERDPKHSFVDWVEFLKETAGNIFGIPSWYFNEVYKRIWRGYNIGSSNPEVYKRAKNNVKQNKRTSRRCRV